MSNPSSNTFSNEIKEVINELNNICNEIGKKILSSKEESFDFLMEFEKSLEIIKNKFEKIFEENLNSANKEVARKIEEKMEEVKPIFTTLIETLTDPNIKFGELLDVAALKIKLTAIYTKIFIRKKVSEIFNK